MSSLKALGLGITPADLFTSSSTQATDLGAVASTGDGRIFRYMLAGGTTLVAGTLQASPAQDQTNISPAGGLAVAAAAIGATQITLTGSLTLTAGQLTGAIMSVAVTPGQGQSLKVKTNTAVSSAANCVVTLEDPLAVALTTSSKVVFAVNAYNGVIINPATVSGMPCGVSIYAVTNAQYGWVQTHGPVSCLIGAADITVGKSVMPSAATAGALIVSTGVLAPVGYTIVGTKTTEYDVVFLTID